MNNIRFMVAAIATVLAQCLCAVNYAEFLLQIDENNTELKAMSVRNMSDLDELRAENSLKGPEVDFSYMFGDHAVGNKMEIGASQSFEWLGVYHSRNKVINTRHESLDYQYEALRRDIHTRVLSLCAEIVWTSKQLDLYSSILSDIDSLTVAYSKAFEYGEVSILDINKLKIERVSALRSIRVLEARRAELQVNLTAANGGIPISVDVFDEYPLLQLPSSLDEYIAYATEKDPMALYYKKQSMADEYEISAAKRSLMPSFSIGYKYMNELGDKFNGITAGISLPLYSGNSVKAARGRKTANNIEAELWSKTVAENLAKEYATAKSLADELVTYDTALSGDNIRLLHKALNAGQISLVEYLLEKRFYIDALIERLEVEYLYIQSLNSINRYNY
ncbi:MAG: TolC family protein [Muribaculaceae bacterium]|nr:TolC family protein [Muribaculaceae bacterium]